MSRWLEEMTQAVLRLCGEGATTRSSDPAAEQQFKHFGDVVHLEEGWYALSTYNRQVNPDDLSDMCLAPRTGPGMTGSGTYRVISYVVEPERLRLQVGAHAPATGLGLWAIGRPADFLEKSLYEALLALGDPGLAERLVSNRLHSVAPINTVACNGVLKGAQAQTYSACTTPGIRVVWGPPGTGKTTVLKRALDDLVTRNKRVLLVSSTNIAVDNALEGAVQTRTGLLPGEMVRVGAPHLTSIAEDPRVCLPLLVRERVQEAEDRRAATESELIALRGSPLLSRLGDLGHLLSGYDPEAYRQAQGRLAHGKHLDRLADKLADAGTAVLEVNKARARCADNIQHAVSAEQAVTPQRQQLAEAARLRNILNDMERDALHGHSTARSAERPLEQARQEMNALTNETGTRARLRNRKRRAELARAIPDLVSGYERFAAAAVRASAEYERQCELLDPRIQALRAAALPIDEAELARRADITARARQDHAEAAALHAAAQHELERIRTALVTAEAQHPRPLPEDRGAVEAAQRAGLPALSKEHERLQEDAKPLLEQCLRLEQHHEQLLKEIGRLRAQAEPDIIRSAKVVATTLARLRIHKTVAAGPYDVVLVDEAAAASLPELVVAVAKARETAVLLGDFCQLGSIEHKRTPKEESLARWLKRDCFELVGIRTPDEAVAHPGCAALLTTHRFGQDVTELVNRIAYGSDRANGPRLTSGLKERDRETDPEIVLITTDRLDDSGLGIARTPRKGSGRWWTAGSVIGQALAEQHRAGGESVGIVTPYSAQADITHDWLADQDSLHRSPAVEVGTAHRFQGREFDVVVLDLVEDGKRLGWTGVGKLDDDWEFARNGARLFNVGATRARRRVYIIAAWWAIDQAAEGTVLSHVKALATPGPDRRILGVRAAQLLGLEESEISGEATSLQREIWQAFDGHVRWDAVYDEHDYFPAALDAIDTARKTVWLWAPWYYTRLWQVLPHLHAAHQRGVRVVVFVVEDADDGLQGQLNNRNAATAAEASRRLPELIASVSQVVRIRTMHQKILIIDEQTTFLGSLNTLSHSPTGSTARREIMVRFRGSRFARSLLEHEHADAFSRPVNCPKCAADMELRKYKVTKKREKKAYYWVWACPTKTRDAQTGRLKECGPMREVYPEDAAFVPQRRRI